MVFKDFSVLVLWTNVASALEGLRGPLENCHLQLFTVAWKLGMLLQNIWRVVGIVLIDISPLFISHLCFNLKDLFENKNDARVPIFNSCTKYLCVLSIMLDSYLRCMDDLTTERRFHLQGMWVIDMLGLLFYMLSMGLCTMRY